MKFVAQPPQQKDRGDGFCGDGFECQDKACSLKHPFGLRRKHFQLTVALNGSSEAYSALVDAMGPGTVDLWERFLHVTVAYVDLECPFDTRGTLCPEDKKFLKETCDRVQKEFSRAAQTLLSDFVNDATFQPSLVEDRLKFVWVKVKLSQKLKHGLATLCDSLRRVEGVKSVVNKLGMNPHFTVSKYLSKNRAGQLAVNLRSRNRNNDMPCPATFSHLSLWRRDAFVVEPVVSQTQGGVTWTYTPDSVARVELPTHVELFYCPLCQTWNSAGDCAC